MPSYQRLAELLPSLYRPEGGDDTLLNALLLTAGANVDTASEQLQHVLRAHWYDVADKASWDAHYLTARGERGLPALNVRNAADQREIRTYPYITDLARLGSLVGAAPWLDGPAVETVEEYRQRLNDLLEAYRLGLTTQPALRRLVEAALPEDMDAEAAGQRWPFAIEEPVAIVRDCQPVTMPAAQEGARVCPLFRWQIDQAGAACPTFYLQGVAAEPGLAVATEGPLLECVQPGRRPLAVGLGYRGTLAPGATLRLRPARRSWRVQDGHWQRSPEEVAANAMLDPAANGPWSALSGSPSGQVLRMAEAIDRTLWALIDNAGSIGLWRYDGSSFSAVSQGAPAQPARDLLAWGDAVYLAGADGLYRVDLFPASGQPFRWSKLSQVTDAVNALSLAESGALALATASGAVLLGPDFATNPAQIQRYLNGIPLHAVLETGDALYAGFDGGLLLWRQQGGGLWYLEAATNSENEQDWQPVDISTAAAASGWLPPVRQLATTPDGALWLGTDAGLARYGAWQAEAGVPRTWLEAFPDLLPGKLNRLAVDERGMLWIAADTGLFRFDGRDISQYDEDHARWQGLGEAALLYPESEDPQSRGEWRYDRSASRWQRYDDGQQRFAPASPALRAGAGKAVADWLLTDAVCAELGSFDGNTFSASAEVPTSQLVVRVKPEETRIVNGGLPALPRAAATATWRYLQLEPASLVVPAELPWWSVEGRLVPPSGVHLPLSGHYRAGADAYLLDGLYDQVVYSYPASAKLWCDRAPAPRVGVRVRLFRRAPDQPVDPAIIERVWAYLSRAKGAGIPMQLFVEGALVKGESA